MGGSKKQVIATALLFATLLCSGCKPVENSLSSLSIEGDNLNENSFKLFQPIAIKSVEMASEDQSLRVEEVIEPTKEVKIGIINDIASLPMDNFVSRLPDELTEQCLNVSIEMVSPETDHVNSYLNSVQELIANGVQIILIPNQAYGQELELLIKNYPDIAFVTLDSVIHAPNVISLKFRDESSAYLAGVIAASQTSNQYIAYLGYEENKAFHQDYVEGFKAGVNVIDDQLLVKEFYVSKQASSSEVKAVIQSIYQDQSDIIFEDIKAHQQAVVSVAKEMTNSASPVWVINSMFHLSSQEKDDYDEEVVLSSTIKQIDIALCQVLKKLLDGNLVLGTQIILGLENNGVDVTLTSESLSETITELVQVYKEKIINGEVMVLNQLPINEG